MARLASIALTVGVVVVVLAAAVAEAEAQARVLISPDQLVNAGAAKPADYILAQKSRKLAVKAETAKPADYILAAQSKLGAALVHPAAVNLNIQACDQLAAYKRACYTLARLPGVTTPRELLEAAVRVSLGRARSAKVMFARAKQQSKAGNPMASILSSCGENYDDLVNALEEAQRSIEKHASSATVVSKLSAASTFAGDCDNWFEERSIASPFEVMQRHVAHVVSVGLGIAANAKQI